MNNSPLVTGFIGFVATVFAVPTMAACSAQTGPTVNPVVELYTSEGCSSCPPADEWVAKLKTAQAQTGAVVQAFHVGYWDYIGWVDRFATPAHTTRQRNIANINHLKSIYTPQLVRDGKDWRGWFGQGTGSAQLSGKAASVVDIALSEVSTNQIKAEIRPKDANAKYAAYWSVTEHGHSSKVSAGENKGEQLKHDFVVRQYQPVGNYKGAQSLSFSPLPPTPGHARQINLVLHDTGTGATVQALSLTCTS